MDPVALWMVAWLLAPPAEVSAPVTHVCLAAEVDVDLALVATVQDPAARLAELQAKEAEFDKAARAAKTPDERTAAMALRPDPKQLSQDYAKVARDAGKTDTALTAWTRALELSVAARETKDKDFALFDEAAERLMADFASSDALAKLAPTFARVKDDNRGEKQLRQLREKSSSNTTKAAATFSLGMLLVEGKSEEARKEGLSFLREVKEKYPDAVDARGRAFSAQADGYIFQAERLQIGMVAPDIEAPDTTGVPFKLSDYRGKVVLLDFWGHW